MFPYDPELLSNLQSTPGSVADVLSIMQAIDAVTVDGDGLKWFNGLYFRVTQAVHDRIAAGGFADPAYLAELDVQFAQLYFAALRQSLSGNALPGCWQTLFSRRDQTELTRLQFALAGVNAHINHDLPMAIVATGQKMNLPPTHNTAQYNDYTALNSTLDGLIEEAKHTLNVRLLGEVLPPAAQLEDTVAAWSISAAREAAWNNAEILGHLQPEALLAASFLDTLDGLTTVVSKSLLVTVPDLA